MGRRSSSSSRSSGSSSSSSGSSGSSSSSSRSSSSRRSSSPSSSSSSSSSSRRSSSPSSSSTSRRSSSPSSSSTSRRSSSPSSSSTSSPRSSTSRKSSSPSSSPRSSTSSSSTISKISKVPESSNFIASVKPKSTITIRETNSEKTARMKAETQARADKVTKAKEIQKGMHVAESYDIHVKKIAGITPEGSSSNYFVNLKTGETSQRASDVTSVNLEAFLKERGYGEITKDFTFGSKTNTMPDIFKPQKLIEERMALKTKEVFLRHQAEIKAKGGIIPELNLMNKEQVKKYTEISDIITNAKQIGTEEAFIHATKEIDNFVTIDNPITQKPKTIGDSKVFETDSTDTSVISQGFSLEPLESDLEEKQTHENKIFTSETQKSIGIVGIFAVGLGLFYFLGRKKNVKKS